ncbi:MAG: YdcF family protein [Bacteroidales bacterium]|nr:YdcF family protein [Bacteroidales bacterium]
MQKASYIIVMGAAVNSDGAPSGAMKRRIESAIIISRKLPGARFIVTGGIGKNGKSSEADAMKDLLLASGVFHEDIIVEDQSTDTLSSVFFCSAILKASIDHGHVVVCSDAYHIPRCRWLFFLAGIRTQHARVISGYKANGFSRWIYYIIREGAAIPYDTIVFWFHKSGPAKSLIKRKN